MRELTLVWMYHNIMDLYGDKGNILVLEKRCKDRGINLKIDYVTINDEYDLSKANILFIGGGADSEQNVVYSDLLSRKENIKEAIENNVMILLICGGFQLFGKYYENKDGLKIEGLGIFDYYSIAKEDKRAIGNVIVECEIENKKMMLCGFENHGGLTYGVTKPLGKVIYGQGNNELDHFEGYFDGLVIGTYLHGPLLPKNVEIADYIIQKALFYKGFNEPLEPLNDELSIQAKTYMIERILKK